MEHGLLKSIIYEQHEIIQNMEIVDREYTFEQKANYVLVGLRRAGKTTLMYKKVRELIASKTEWNRIICVNFEDERLLGFTVNDFNDILQVAAEMSDKKAYFFFDEIQIVEGWEHFARRLADSKEQVWITGSNAKMISREVASTLGGRYMVKYIEPYNFKEYLDALQVLHDEKALLTTKQKGKIIRNWGQYLKYGGLPESVHYQAKREYITGVYQKVLLGDVVSRNKLRNDTAISMLVKKLAESVRSDVSFTKLQGIVNSVGIKVSKDTVISYVEMLKDAYLIFDIKNFFTKFAERESNPKYYFGDNGILNLFLYEKNSILLENIVALTLHRNHPDSLYFLKSAQTGIDVDFFLGDTKTAYQVCFSLSDESFEREVENLIRLSKSFSEAENYIIITNDEERKIEKDGITILVIPAYKLLLSELR